MDSGVHLAREAHLLGMLDIVAADAPDAAHGKAGVGAEDGLERELEASGG